MLSKYALVYKIIHHDGAVAKPGRLFSPAMLIFEQIIHLNL